MQIKTGMERLSSRLTLLWKMFPLLWIPWLASWIGVEWWKILYQMVQRGHVYAESKLILSTFFFLGLTLLLFWLCWPLRRVYLSGGEVVVCNFSGTRIISMSNVASIEGPDISTLRRVTINLKAGFDDFNEQRIIFAPRIFHAKKIVESLENLVTLEKAK